MYRFMKTLMLVDVDIRSSSVADGYMYTDTYTYINIYLSPSMCTYTYMRASSTLSYLFHVVRAEAFAIQ